MLEGRHDFEEVHSVLVLTGLDHSGLNVLGSACAARVGDRGRRGLFLSLTCRLLALELTLGLGAQSGLLALPVALGLLAERGALGIGSNALSVALGRGADGLALGARGLLAHVLGATDRALGLLTVDSALGARSLLTLHLALRALADGVAHSGAHRVVALPAAFGVAPHLGGRGHADQSKQGHKQLHGL